MPVLFRDRRIYIMLASKVQRTQITTYLSMRSILETAIILCTFEVPAIVGKFFESGQLSTPARGVTRIDSDIVIPSYKKPTRASKVRSSAGSLVVL